MKELLAYFAESVHEERTSQDLTLRELASRAALQPSTLSRLENGERSQPTLETVLRVAYALQVEPKHLLPDLSDMKDVLDDGSEDT